MVAVLLGVRRTGRGWRCRAQRTMKPRTIRLPFPAPSMATLEQWLVRFLAHPVALDPDPGAGDTFASYRLNREWIERGMRLAGEQEACRFLRRLMRTGRRGGLEQRFEAHRQEARQASSPPRLEPRRAEPRPASPAPRLEPRRAEPAHTPLSVPRFSSPVEEELARLRCSLSDLGRSLTPNPEWRAWLEARIAELERQKKGL